MDFGLDEGGQDYSGLFKITNIFVGGVTALLGLTQLFIFGIQATLLAIFIVASGALITYLEFKVPPAAYKYFSFLFSFIGRGIFYIFLGIIVSQSLFRTILGVIITLIGVGFTVLEFIPSFGLPENMQSEGGFLGNDAADDII